MLLYLTKYLAQFESGFNVFNYLTMRAILGALTALVLSFVIGPKMIAKLLRRVDIIPPSLAIAQSITESGWGTSRFAQKGRALYGQRTWSRGGGIIPKQRRSGETYEVRADGELLTCEPATELPMAQRYFLY